MPAVQSNRLALSDSDPDMATADAVPGASPGDHTKALTLIAESAVMTLAVTTVEGPWAAPVYYVYHPADKGFYFFSAPDSRHVSASEQTGSCGAAIFKQATTATTGAWQQICGLQMQGRLSRANVLEGARTLPRYLRKFPFTRTMLPDGEENLETFRRHFGVRLYRFEPQRIEWSDNRVRFGYRCSLTL
jgi:uncharacterized protein YhbP (UPF0306 family)